MTSPSHRKLPHTALSLPNSELAGTESAAEAGSPVIVSTLAGRIRGAMSGGIASFKGVRYGATTEGRRFQPPLPPKPWENVVDALDYGNQSPQPSSAFEAITILQGFENPRPNSEDCLFLNVWTQGLRDGKKRPVMVWLHGGGFDALSGSCLWFEGTRLSKRGDVVVVTLNHRLAAFGYLHLGDAAGPEYADSGNAGTLDQILALKWVRDNIAEFGGDPGNVTIFGESGGGGKVGTLMSAPGARGLFHRAVVQSGSMLRNSTKEDALQNTGRLMGKAGIPASDVKRLATMPFEDLMAAASGISHRPVVDGRTLPSHPFEPQAPEESRDVPLLVGVNKDEMTALAGVLWPAASPFDATFEQLPERLAPMLEGIDASTVLSELKSIYPHARASDLFFTAASWAMFRSNMVVQAERKAAQGGAPAYAYVLDWETPVEGGKWKSPHGLEVPMVFDNLAAATSTVGPVDGQKQRIADVMCEAWIQFARTGDPGWPAFDAHKRMTMVFNSSSKVVADPDERERALFTGRVHSMLL